MFLTTSYRYSFFTCALLALFLLLPQTSSQAQSGEFYSIDGSDNNSANPEYGQTLVQLTRMHTAAYADGISEPRGGGINEATTLPNPRDISNALNDQPALNPNSDEISDMFWQWGQFLDHDITLVHEADPEEEFIIPVAFGDPHYTLGLDMTLKRSEYDPATGITDPRQQLNSITAWMDGSHIYGSDAVTAAELRTGDGKMAMTAEGFLINDPDNENGEDQFLSGDVRVNEQPGLTAMHTLFSREHNRLADELKAEFPTLTDEEIYQRARMLVIAEMQQITFNEFLPILLGDGAPDPYAGYDDTVSPDIAQEFATGCYRFGHSMVSGTINFADLNGDISNTFDLRDVYFNPDVIRDNGIEGFLYGLTLKEAQTLDLEVVDDMRNLLFVGVGTFGIGLDLAALNIQRGRDHGLPSYNDFREAMGMTAATDFTDIDTDTATAQAIGEVYDSVDDIDLWIGGLSENPVNGGLIGETCAHVIADQFERIRDGDRFWNEGYDWTSIGFEDNDPVLFDGTTVSSVTLKDVINWNSDLNIVTDRSVMYVVDPTVEPTPTPTIEPTATPTEEPTATPTVEPTPTNTATPTPEPTFSATVGIEAPVDTVEIGDEFDVVVSLDVAAPCEYPVFDITLLVDDAGAQLEFVDPDSAKFGPPVTMPFTYTVRATEAGDIGLTARLYGERFCGGAYVFTYLNSEEVTVAVAEPPTPTATATDVPTETPTFTPTATEEPTATPTDEPTATPTDEPTATPTDEPTAEPTATEEPTAAPTDEPTPTVEPTATPTEEPTPTPTATPAVQGATLDPPTISKLVETETGDKTVTVATRGELVTYLLEVTNPNDKAITNVIVTDVIDTLTVYQDTRAAGADIGFAEASNTLSVAWDTIPANSSRTIEIDVKVLATAEIGDAIKNVASVTSSAGANDSDETMITVIPGEIPNTGNSLLGLADTKVELLLILLIVAIGIAVPTGLRRKARMS